MELSAVDSNLIESKENGFNQLQVTKYDNDVTLLYKWASLLGTPTRLIVVRPRTAQDYKITSGTTAYVFESLTSIVRRLYEEGETIAGIYETIKTLKPAINIKDITMTFVSLTRNPNPEAYDPNFYNTINQIYRQMDNSSIETERFTSQENLDNEYANWFRKIIREMNIEKLKLTNIIDIQSKLSEVDQQQKIPFSPIIISSAIMSFGPTIEDRPVTTEDGLDIFNKAVVSKYIPYIKYNNKYGRSFSRVYVGGKIDNEPNYNITVLSDEASNINNSIYMMLWLGDPNSDNSDELHDATRDSFSKIRYHLDTNYLTVESPIQTDTKKGLINNENIAYNRARNALPSINFGEGKEVKVRGEFNMWGITFDETTLVDMILTEPLLNVYLYIEEKDKPFALKKRLDVHYRSIFTDEGEGGKEINQAYITNSASVSITLIPKKTIVQETVDVIDENGNVSKATVPQDMFYIHVNILQAESRNVINEFIPIFRLLMRYYLDDQQNIANIYETYLPGVKDQLDVLLTHRKRKTVTTETGILGLTKKKVINHKNKTKIKLLQELAPELFVLNYARRCQCPLQPIIIDPEDREAWAKTRQIMPFPPNNPKWLIVCPDDANPQPGVKLNHDLPNRDKYPYIPCCFKHDQMSPGVDSRYRDYIEGKPIGKKSGAKAENKISTRKFLAPDRVALLPRSVGDLLKRYSEEHVDIVRYGVIYTPNSLLHCACNAVDDPNYMKLVTDEEKEQYVTRVRQHMLATILPSLLKQELYDYSDEEITNMFANNEQFFDPSLFFRAIEETFGINIYVFKPAPPISNDIDLGKIDLPRFKIFHARPLRVDRPTMLIIKMGGSESNALQYPQCELIVDYDKDNFQIMKLFGPKMTEICHEAIQQSIKTMTWTTLTEGNFEVHSNIYYYIDHLSIFNMSAVSQFIDDNGKMRAVTLDTGEGLITVAIIPSRPENLPVTTLISRISKDIVTRIFGDPISITRDAKGKVDGLWYKIMDIKNGEYVPIVPFDGYDNLPLGPANPVQSSKVSVTKRLSKLRRTLNIIVQLVRWLYEIARAKYHGIDPNTFAGHFMRIDVNPNVDSADYYDLSNISRRLPAVDSVEIALDIFEKKAPSLISGRKIIMYNNIFAERIIKMLRDYNDFYPELQPMTPNLQGKINNLCVTNDIRSITELRAIAIALKIAKPQTLSKANLCSAIRSRYKDSIENFYETESDFDQTPNSKIFMNGKDLKSWMNSLKSSHNYGRYFNIRDKLDIAITFPTNSYYKDEENNRINPYIYKDVDNKIYIIQNVRGGNKAKALTVANTWLSNGINLGSDPVPSISTPIHMVYTISPASKLEPAQDLTNGSNIFLKLLYYGSRQDLEANNGDKYAAILEIL